MSDLNQLLSKNSIILFYISHEECSVCKSLKPKIVEMIENNFSEIEFHYIDINKTPEVASQLLAMTVPTIILYIDRKEYLRIGRNVSVEILKEKINRLLELRK